MQCGETSVYYRFKTPEETRAVLNRIPAMQRDFTSFYQVVDFGIVSDKPDWLRIDFLHHSADLAMIGQCLGAEEASRNYMILWSRPKDQVII